MTTLLVVLLLGLAPITAVYGWVVASAWRTARRIDPRIARRERNRRRAEKERLEQTPA